MKLTKATLILPCPSSANTLPTSIYRNNITKDQLLTSKSIVLIFSFALIKFWRENKNGENHYE